MPNASEHTLVRAAPRISANELARYMISSESGKLGIIRSARESSAPPRTRYKDARKACRAFLTADRRDLGLIEAARERLAQRAADASLSTFARSDAECSVDALDSFLGMRNQLTGFDYLAAPHRQQKLLISGVEISVYADLLIHREQRGSAQVGAALFRFTQSDSDTDAAQAKRREIGKWAATLLHMHVTENLSGNREPHPAICLSVDVQFGEATAAPKSVAKRTKDIEAACRFIAAMWEHA
jgi:hypothetical protein